MKYLIRGCLGFVLLLCAACDIPQMDSVLATVGQQNITREDVVYRIGTAKAFGQQEAMNALAMVYMIENALTRQIAAQHGIVVSKQEVVALAAEMDKGKDIKAHKELNAVKWVYGDDLAGYYRVYVAPKLFNRKLHNWFARNVSRRVRLKEAMQRDYAQTTAGQGDSPFDAWFRQQAQKLTVHIKDQQLRAEVRKSFPHMWWFVDG